MAKKCCEEKTGVGFHSVESPGTIRVYLKEEGNGSVNIETDNSVIGVLNSNGLTLCRYVEEGIAQDDNKYIRVNYERS